MAPLSPSSFHIDDLPVYFPYERIYPEQYAYMCSLKQALDAQVSFVSCISITDPLATFPLTYTYCCFVHFFKGPWSARDALGNWKDRVAAVPHHLISTGTA